MFPLYAVVTLNDTFYDATCWAFRAVFGIRSSRALAILGLGGEVALFGAGLWLIRSLFSS